MTQGIRSSIVANNLEIQLTFKNKVNSHVMLTASYLTVLAASIKKQYNKPLSMFCAVSIKNREGEWVSCSLSFLEINVFLRYGPFLSPI